MDTENFKESLKWHFRHKREKNRALKALQTIEGNKGKTNPKFIKLSNEYAREVLGSKVYAPWLYVYSALQNKFMEGWIPDNYYKKEVVPRLKGDYAILADRNFTMPILFPKIDTLNVGYFINRKFCSVNNKILNTENFKEHIFKTTNKLVYKLENSKQGKGVFIIDKNSFDAFSFFSRENRNGVFQKYIEQHPFFAEFTNNSVATIRITTTSNELGYISVRASYLRLGRNKDTHVKSSSAINVPLNINTGEFNSKAYTSNWKEFTSHPDSNILFENKIIPNFEKCKEKAIEMHSEIPFMGCIGWDLALDKYGEVQLIEWNGLNNGILLSEAVTGPCFKDLNWENIWKRD